MVREAATTRTAEGTEETIADPRPLDSILPPIADEPTN
jgi:hypothetical protein